MLESLHRAVSGQPQYRTDRVAPLISLVEAAWQAYAETGAPGHGILVRGALKDFWEVVEGWDAADQEGVSLDDLLAAS